MQVRGARRRQGFDRGFVVSDHADWPGLLEVIAATGAERVLATHGQVVADFIPSLLMDWPFEELKGCLGRAKSGQKWLFAPQQIRAYPSHCSDFFSRATKL